MSDKKKNLFYSTDNFNMLYEILGSDIKKKFNFNIENNNECRQILFSNMETAFTKNKNKDLKQINIITIKNTGPLLYQKIQNRNQISEDSKSQVREVSRTSKEIPIRDISLGKKVPEYTNMRPEFYQKDQSITDSYEKLNQERNESQQTRQEKINFSLPLSTQNDTNPDEMFQKVSTLRQHENKKIDREKHNQFFKQQNNAFEHFENVSQQLKETEQQYLTDNQQQQEQQYQQFEQQQKLSSNQENNLSKNNVVEDFKINQDDVSSISEIHKRIQQESQIRQQNDAQDFNPSLIYEKDDKHEKEYRELMSKPVDNRDFINNNLNLKSKSRDKKNFIEIESIDRLLENTNHSRYSFKVSFSPAFKQLKRLPMFENNPTILASPEQSQQGKRGSPNKEGWTTSDGDKYPAYNSSKPYGQVISYEDITYLGSNNLYIENNFRNIREIKVLNLIIPYEYILHHGDLNPSSERDMVALREPYLLINIQEINGIYNSTSEIIANSFCKLIRDDDWNSDPRGNSNKDQYHGNIKFIPSIDCVSKTYYPAPLANLNSFTIQILRPNGELISTSKDYANISYIKFYSPDGSKQDFNLHLEIKLDTFVDSTIFKSYSDIIIKDYMIPIDPELCIAKESFETFINRSSGHTIMWSKNSNQGQSYGHVNLIYISSQGSFNDITGKYENNNYGDSVNLGILESNLRRVSDIYSHNNFKGNNPFGTVFNTSYQSHISFEITTLENDTEDLEVRLI